MITEEILTYEHVFQKFDMYVDLKTLFVFNSTNFDTVHCNTIHYLGQTIYIVVFSTAKPGQIIFVAILKRGIT